MGASAESKGEDRFTRVLRRAAEADTRPRRLLRRAMRLLPQSARNAIQDLLKKPTRTSRAVERFAARHGNDVRFVQIGSCDGVTGDPIHDYVVQRKWQGVVVEPVPYNFERLSATYRDQPQVQCKNVAITRESGTMPFYYMEEHGDELPPWHRQVGSFDRGHLLKHKVMLPNIEDYIVEREIECMSLSDLIDSAGMDRIDLLHTDVEGHDFELIKQIDFSRFKPALILFEALHMKDDDLVACTKLLEAQGYTVESSDDDMDALAYLPEA